MGEPIRWTGGVLAFFPKPGKLSAKTADHREIILSDVVGKVYKKWQRAQILMPFVKKARATQMAGFRRRACDFGSVYLRAQTDRILASGSSCACLFVDVNNAFYNLNRVLLVDGPSGFAGILRRWDIPQELVQAVWSSWE